MRIRMLPKAKVLDLPAGMIGKSQQDIEYFLTDLERAVKGQMWGKVLSDANAIAGLAMRLSTAVTMLTYCKQLHGEEVSRGEKH